jgi:hypothetical protein
MGEQSVLDLVPFRGAGREMTDRDRQPGLGGQRRELAFPDPVAVAVQAAGIGGDQQPGRHRVVDAAAGTPPAADGLDCEHRGVVVDPNVDPAGVAVDVVDAVRDRLLDVWAGEKEVVVFDLDRLAGRTPFSPGHRQVSEVFALFGVHADHRFTRRLMLFGLVVDVAELSVPIRVLGAFEGLGIGLQAEPGRAQ